MESKGLLIVYATKNFMHYFFANKFVFFIDHQELIYLVNKPCVIGWIARWFVILLEFDFMVAVKNENTHQQANHLSRIPLEWMMIYQMLPYFKLKWNQDGQGPL